MKPLTTPTGRTYVVLGDAGVVTLDRLEVLTRRLDSDPRIASISVVAHPDPGEEFLRATAPAGCAVVLATDVEPLTGALPEEFAADQVLPWARLAADRGLWHDWWLSGAADIAASTVLLDVQDADAQEVSDPATSHNHAVQRARIDPRAISLTVDATWLGPHQTGAQVLTTAAIEALASNPRISAIRLAGLSELPSYAQHLAEIDKIHLADSTPFDDPTDAVWYPNQIDQRVDISSARVLGRRVITTYLDLIAYDIRRYHASDEAWLAYRSLQRRIALSVDGITTISADVATRLLDEVPRLNPARVRPIPLGLDHIQPTDLAPGGDLSDLSVQLTARPFLLVLGNDFQHKNRDFAIRVWERLLDSGTNCDLVLAGLHVKSSSSREAESVLLSQHTNLRGVAYTLDHVEEQSREWLLANAAAVVYPSSAEGFGFVPYEAAALGTPSTFTAFGPLHEISQLNDVPQGWSIDSYASDVERLLSDPESAHRRVTALRSAIARHSWSGFAEQLVDFICEVDQMPTAEASLVAGSAADASALAAVLSSKTWRVTAPLRRFGSRLKGRG